MDWKKLLCKIGFHDWSDPRATYLSGSNVKGFTKYCKRCKKQKRYAGSKLSLYLRSDG